MCVWGGVGWGEEGAVKIRKGAKSGRKESQATDKIYMKGNPFNLIIISKL